MRIARHTFRILAASLLAVAGCDRATDQLTAPRHSRQEVVVMAATVNVSNIEELYDAVNDPANEGASIHLSPGTYVLSVLDSTGAARPNNGRIEVQKDMSLHGVSGNRGAVIIDASALPASAFNVSFGRTAGVRIGRGNNAVEWLTIAGHTAAAAGIATELGGTPATRIRIANVLASGSSRGADIRNVGAAMVGRRIEAEVIDSEFIGPPEVVGITEGIRVANFAAAHNGVIIATLSGNRASGYQLGCIVANNRSNNATITVRSSGDRFFGNTAGCEVAGGLSQTTGVANSSSVTFHSHGSKFIDNTAGIPGIDPGGLRIFGGFSSSTANITNNNTVSVEMWGSKVADNEAVELDAYGAYLLTGSGVAGTNNHVTIKLHGVSKRIDLTSTASLPAEAAATNTVTVMR